MPNLAETLVQLQAGGKISEQAAGYMELAGAKKDAGCQIVDVKGGVSSELGCCNLFFPKAKKVQRFHCEDCKYRVV